MCTVKTRAEAYKQTQTNTQTMYDILSIPKAASISDTNSRPACEQNPAPAAQNWLRTVPDNRDL